VPNTRKFQVVIVGGGPVGVGLAVALGLRGITCAVIERRTELQNIPKGQNLTSRTLEHFYFWGIADELRAARIMPKGYPITSITCYGNLLSEYWYSPPHRELVRKYYYEDVERLPQYLTENVLRTRLAGLPNVENRFGWAAETIEADDAGVRVTISQRESGEREVLEADYLVGCDGSHSLVREQAGITRGGTDFDQMMLLAVFRSRELHELLKRFPERGTYNVLHPDLEGYWQFFGRIDVGEGFFFHAPVPSDATTDNYDFHSLVHRAAGREFAVEFDYVGFWDLRVAVADTYRAGRVLIAGDAAHSHPPYGGYGLNNGLEDAVNLGWKLAAVLQGWGGEGLLRSYSEERHPVFKETGEDFIAARIKADAAWLARYNPDRNRAEFERAWGERQTGAADAVSGYEPNYEGSPLVAGPPGGKSSAHGVHSFAARAGHHLAPQPLSNGRNVFEELGPGFTLLAFGVDDAAVRPFEQAAAAARIPLHVVRDGYDGGREAYEHRLVLVRPDQYVAWAGDRPPADVAASLAKFTGR
jgi:2-polyprenyl-6-methoxyphenol hydroxylase-like FAD-dependent oxidoreductase